MIVLNLDCVEIRYANVLWVKIHFIQMQDSVYYVTYCLQVRLCHPVQTLSRR